MIYFLLAGFFIPSLVVADDVNDILMLNNKECNNYGDQMQCTGVIADYCCFAAMPFWSVLSAPPLDSSFARKTSHLIQIMPVGLPCMTLPAPLPVSLLGPTPTPVPSALDLPPPRVPMVTVAAWMPTPTARRPQHALLSGVSSVYRHSASCKLGVFMIQTY